MVYSNLDPGTQVEATLRDQKGLLASRKTPELSGSGEQTIDMTITPKKAGIWEVKGAINAYSNFKSIGDNKTIKISVIKKDLNA